MLIRGTSLTGYVDLVDELGGDGRRLLTAAGVDPAAVGDFGSFIGYVAALEAIETAAGETGAGDFGRRLASRQGIEVLGPVGVAARTAPTLGKAIGTLVRYLRAYTPANQPRLVPAGPDVQRFHLERTMSDLPPYSQGAEVGLTLALRVVRLLAGPDWRPVLVEVAHQPLASPLDYRRHFGAPVEFGQPANGFLVRATDLERPLSTDASTHEQLVGYLRSIAEYQPEGVVPVVDDLVRRLLPGGRADLPTVATELGVHPRTVQRRLEEEGVTFGEVVEGVRRRTAEAYLRDTDMSLRHLATELGYLEQSTFSRAGRRWFGMSPQEYRRSLRMPVG